ncbi:F-box/LRR-repeat protein At3g48880-like [Macadamia integrifolia]|uniref:F-box/LRR-repeat protein At3g48880-like n=1 Tax=Macadamia integrifolia TaxID=60698 RepID=UPI001C4E8878|nr:F-box/LRR-repeat protein At3g48880-like [Macadamia integrifolia]
MLTRRRKEDERRNWKELNTDCLVMVLERVGMESLILDVPFVCKSWYRASLNPQCWKTLLFPVRLYDFHLYPRMTWPHKFIGRFMNVYQLQKFSVEGFVKLIVTRSRRSCVNILLPSECTSELLEFISNECPALKALVLPFDLMIDEGKVISKLVSKWKDLEQLHLGSTLFSFEEILTEVSLNCKNFNGLSVNGFVWNEEASTIATLLPKIKYLRLRMRASVPCESLKIIREGCKELVLLDAMEYCIGFQGKNEEIFKMASHIETIDYDAEEDFYIEHITDYASDGSFDGASD